MNHLKVKVNSLEAYEILGNFNVSCYGEDGSHLVFRTWLSSMEEAKYLALRIKERGYVNLQYWYHFEKDRFDYDNSKEVNEMIENDRLPDGVVPGFRD